ncbi:MAG: AAA family ATPase [Chloroflexota bacterium]
MPYLREIRLNREQVDTFDHYPFSIPAVHTLETLPFHPNVTFFVGENGSGKSTIIEAIATLMGFGPEGGTKNVRIQSTDDISPLYEYLQPIKNFRTPRDYYFLRAESFYNVATYMDEVGYLAEYGGQSLHERSHGEAFLATLTNKLKGNGLYIFDEPEAALSPTRQMVALSAIHQLVERDSQFVIATHSPILLSYPNAKILQLNERGMAEVRYEETEHYTVTRDFLNNYEQMLHLLLDEGEMEEGGAALYE